MKEIIMMTVAVIDAGVAVHTQTSAKNDSMKTINLSFTFKTHYTKGITIGATIYNLFDTEYKTNGYSQSVSLYENGDKNKTYTLNEDPRFYPMPGTNVLAYLTVRF